MRWALPLRRPVLTFRLTMVVLVAILLSQVHLSYAAPQQAATSPPGATNLYPQKPTNGSQACIHAASHPNPTQAENTCLGTTDWQATLPAGPANAIMGYVAPASVERGQPLQLYVSTLAPIYQFDIFRLGWYAGLGGRLMYRSPPLVGVDQPAPLFDPATRMVSASNWLEPVVIHIPTSWVSGVYVVKLISSDGFMRYTLFVVRDDASHAQIQIVIPFLTYQAYNTWGGYSLYDGSNENGEQISSLRATAVSFDRPYALGEGLGDLPRWDVDSVRWFERMGYDVTYVADTDLESGTYATHGHRLIVVSGHAEYWSSAMRTALTSARDIGTSLAFLGGDDVYWRVRLQDSALGPNRVEVCYRFAALDPLSATSPGEATVRWRDPPLEQPEGALLGAMYTGIYRGNLPLTFTAAAAPWLAGTGLRPGSLVPGLIGTEVDAVYVPTTAALYHGVTVLATTYIAGQYTTQNECSACGHWAAATLYVANSGAHVFDAGSLQFVWGLDDASFNPTTTASGTVSPAFQLFMRHLVGYLLG